MNSDPASLENLYDIVEPPPVPWWPPAPGWWILAALLFAAACALAIHRYRKWRADAYRRAALRQVEAARTTGELATILKRTALAAFPRTEIASLAGAKWRRWLEKTGGQAASEEVARLLEVGVYRNPESSETSALAAFTLHWITRHKRWSELSNLAGTQQEQVPC